MARSRGVRVAVDDGAARRAAARSRPEAAPRAASPAPGRSMSAPRSKRNEASVDSASRLLVRRTETGSNQALSNATRTRYRPSTSESAPPMTPATACGREPSAMTSMSPASLPHDAVQRPHGLSRPRAADPQLASREPVEVERVHRVAELEHHVVGDVDDVVDRPYVGCLQARRHPARRRADADLRHRGRVPGAQRESAWSSMVTGSAPSPAARCRLRAGHVIASP